jgi:hypothetical protein
VRPACVLIVAAAALPLGACSLELKPGAEGILDAFQTTAPRPEDMAVQAMDKYDANNRYIGTRGLATQNYAGEPLYMQLFIDNADDPDPGVRAAAARGLANHGQPEHAPLLVAGLQDLNPNVRLEAARGLQRLYSEAAINPLINAIREPELRRTGATPGERDAEVRAQAAQALGQYPTTFVLEALIAALDDSNLAVNRNALESLRTLTGQDFGLDRAAWADWRSRTSEHFAARRLYTYPVFNRPYEWYEHLPLVPKPPNEVAGIPTGTPRQ